MSTFDKARTDVQTALTEFDEALIRAFMKRKPSVLAALGIVKRTNALKTKFPLPLSAPGFEILKGDPKYRHLSEKLIEVVTDVYQDGVEELARIIESDDWFGWEDEPEKMAANIANMPDKLLAALLEANDACGWDGLAFFHNTHKAHPGGAVSDTFDNTSGTTTLNEAGVETAMYNLSQVPGPDGQPLNLELTHLVVPPALKVPARKLANQTWTPYSTGASTDGDRYVPADNWLKGAFEVVVCSRLTDVSVWYAVAAEEVGMAPWGYQERKVPETVIFDKSSDYYKDTLKVRYGVMFEAGAALLLPHCIHKYDED